MLMWGKFMSSDCYNKSDEKYYEEYNKIDFCFNKVSVAELKKFLLENDYELSKNADLQNNTNPVWFVIANKKQKTQIPSNNGICKTLVLTMILAAISNNYFSKPIFYVNEYAFYDKEIDQEIDLSQQWQNFLYKKFGQKYLNNLEHIIKLQKIRDKAKKLEEETISEQNIADEK